MYLKLILLIIKKNNYIFITNLIILQINIVGILKKYIILKYIN